MGKFSKADAAHLKIPHVAARTTADPATVGVTNRILGRSSCLHDLRCLGHAKPPL